jgi:propanediol dehydratase large subunit
MNKKLITKRLEVLEKRAVNNDCFVIDWLEEGFVAMESPLDPEPSINIENGIIVEMDGKKREEFDFVELFIADNAINVEQAAKMNSITPLEVARMIVDPNIKREEILNYTTALTPAFLLKVLNSLNVVEMMMALQKMRPRKTPKNQAHVTNAKDNPVLLACDAAEAALRGFDEIETTVAVLRDAPLNALSILVGSQVGRPGVITQCAVEEALELKLGILGFTTYAETISVYGTEKVFIDGDDTPWSKAFLASAYASRGIKMRFTSGTGAETLMANTNGNSMLYNEIKCVMIARGAGVQGLQNGSISCIAIPASVSGGLKAVLAENLLATMLDLEVAAGSDQTFSHSDLRRTARTIPQLFSGADLIFSGYSAVPNKDNMFAGSNFDYYDFDDFNIICRDFKIDGGLKPVKSEDIIKIRRRAAKALQEIYEELEFSIISDEEIEAAVYANTSDDLIERNRVNDLKCAKKLVDGNINGLDIVRILYRGDYLEVSEAIFNLLKQRCIGDYLQTSAVFDRNFNVISAINDKNDYSGPGTGYRISDIRWNDIKKIDQAIDSKKIFEEDDEQILEYSLCEIGRAKRGKSADEIVIGISVAFADSIKKTISNINHDILLKEIMAGIEEEGLNYRIIKILESTDLGYIGIAAAKLSGSGISVGLQSRGTAIIHQKDLNPLNNLELFPQAPLLDLKLYRQIGKNAAKYAKGMDADPIFVDNDPMARPKFQPLAAVLHIKETRYMEAIQKEKGKIPIEYKLISKKEVNNE